MACVKDAVLLSIILQECITGEETLNSKVHLTTCCHTARKHRLLVQQEDLLEFYQEEVWNIAASGPHRDQKECLYWKKL